MRSIRIALAQLNATVGDLAGNAEAVLDACQRAHDAGATLVAFPEMFLTGYPIEDLALRHSFQQASRAALADLARELDDHGLGDLIAVVGYLDADDETSQPALGRPAGGARNAAAIVHQGKVQARYFKHHLPNYGVFDEYRYFVPGADSLVVRIGDVNVALAICEDLWQEGGPVADVAARGADLLLVLNASPYERSKDDTRLALCQRRAREAQATLAYVNLVGGQDELVFDGDSLIVDPAGEVLNRAFEFVDELVVADLEFTGGPGAGRSEPNLVCDPAPATLNRPERPEPTVAPELSDVEEVYRAITLGVRDYVQKNGIGSVALGLSGGIDSAVVAAIAVDALGPERVIGVAMPSEYSSEHSVADAAELAERTRLNYRQVPIAPMVTAYQDQLHFTGLAEENLQARVRGTTLMGISNAEGPLVLATGNKSEIAVGYSTIYGDAVGGFAPLKDVPKTLVWELARWRNDQAERTGETPPIPENSISKPPSAELRPGQQDSDSLPDYELLDQVLEAYVERDQGGEALLAQGFDSELVEQVIRMVDAAEYKRRQYPPGTKITFRAFGRDRRLPITSRWRERLADDTGF